MEEYVLVLVPLHKDMHDLSGTEFPDRGFVKCYSFQDDQDIQTGLYGAKWGDENGIRTFLLFAEKFAVVRHEGRVIVIDAWANVVKFEQGYVVFVGNKDECLTLMKSDIAYQKQSPNTESKI